MSNCSNISSNIDLLDSVFISDNKCGDYGIYLGDKIDATSINNVGSFVDMLNSNIIDVKNRQSLSTYPTLRLLYERYINQTNCDNKSNGFNYETMDGITKSINTYWVDLIEQFIPSTTIWGSTIVYRNTIFDTQKLKYRANSLFFCDVEYMYDRLPNLITSCGTTGTTSGETCNLLGNPSFEEFAECGGLCTGANCAPPTTFRFYPEECVPFWQTTAPLTNNPPTRKIEIWKSGNGGVPAYEGEYFAEINSNTNNPQALFQPFQVTPGNQYQIQFAHRGRLFFPNTMRVAVSGATNGIEFIGEDPYTGVVGEWTFHTIDWIAGVDTTYNFMFSSTTATDGGNFIDAVRIVCLDDPNIIVTNSIDIYIDDINNKIIDNNQINKFKNINKDNCVNNNYCSCISVATNYCSPEFIGRVIGEFDDYCDNSGIITDRNLELTVINNTKCNEPTQYWNATNRIFTQEIIVLENNIPTNNDFSYDIIPYGSNTYGITFNLIRQGVNKLILEWSIPISALDPIQSQTCSFLHYVNNRWNVTPIIVITDNDSGCEISRGFVTNQKATNIIRSTTNINVGVVNNDNSFIEAYTNQKKRS